MASYAIMAQASLLVRRGTVFADGAFVELKAWSVPAQLPLSAHRYKYSLVYIVDGKRLVGYDNERGKGDHRHFGDVETSYTFTTLERLLDDFASDVHDMRSAPRESEHNQ